MINYATSFLIRSYCCITHALITPLIAMKVISDLQPVIELFVPRTLSDYSSEHWPRIMIQTILYRYYLLIVSN